MGEYKHSVLGDKCTQCKRSDVKFYKEKRTRKCMKCYGSQVEELRRLAKIKYDQDRQFSRSFISRAW